MGKTPSKQQKISNNYLKSNLYIANKLAINNSNNKMFNSDRKINQFLSSDKVRSNVSNISSKFNSSSNTDYSTSNYSSNKTDDKDNKARLSSNHLKSSKFAIDDKKPSLLNQYSNIDKNNKLKPVRTGNSSILSNYQNFYSNISVNNTKDTTIGGGSVKNITDSYKNPITISLKRDSIKKLPSSLCPTKHDSFSNIHNSYNNKQLIPPVNNKRDLVNKYNSSKELPNAKELSKTESKYNSKNLPPITSSFKKHKEDLPSINNKTNSNKSLNKVSFLSSSKNNSNINLSEINKENGVLEKIEEETDFIKSIIQDLSQFNLIKVIGRGTFGKVVLVTLKTDISRVFALKIIKKQHIVQTKNVANIINEKKILQEVDCPFLIKLRYSFQNKEKIFMAFDYHNGGELFYHLQKRKRLPENDVKIYAAQIYIALRYLHNRMVVYRDLKPENIILDKNGYVKIIDFGLAKRLNKNNMFTKSFCGTNEYIPPEVLLSNEYNFNFDWWGFGVILFELLHGIPPFVDNNKRELFKKILKTEPNYNLKILTPNAVDIMKKLLNKDPNKRMLSTDIPNHPWFNGVDFNKIENMEFKPPFKPETKNQTDISNIDPIFLNEQIISPYKPIKALFDDNLFSDF